MFIFSFKQLVMSVQLKSKLNIFMRLDLISHKEKFCLLYDWIVAVTLAWCDVTC
jgi:hypothetical protein